MNTTSLPTFCGFLAHLGKRLFCTEHYSLGTLAGLLLVLLNVPVGWGGCAVCLLIARYYKISIMYRVAGLVYLLSWLMLGTGILLAGAGTVRAFRARIPRGWKAWRRARKALGSG